VSTEPSGLKDIGKSRWLWLGYGAEFLTVFFAIAVLAGRVYAQSYWKVFGLSPELVDTTFINYAIMSPNTAVASILMAASTVVLIAFLQLPDLVDDNPKFAYYIGFPTMLIGLFFVGVILNIDTSSWTSGTAGLVFGLGYLGFIGGLLIWTQAGVKLESGERSKWEIAVFRWLSNIPRILALIFLIVLFTATSIWAIVDTAQKFGSNEAKFMYDARPIVILQLDSPKGFEDLALFSDPSGAALMKVRIITEAGGFLYISPGVERITGQLNIRAVPVSRVQAIQYGVDITPIGD